MIDVAVCPMDPEVIENLLAEVATEERRKLSIMFGALKDKASEEQIIQIDQIEDMMEEIEWNQTRHLVKKIHCLLICEKATKCYPPPPQYNSLINNSFSLS